MSELKVEVVTIDKMDNLPKADRLEVAYIGLWQCVVQKNRFIVGQPVVYIPIDSILPAKLEEYLFPPDSKIKLDRHRVRSIKIRGALSQGMILSFSELMKGGFLPGVTKVGTDLADALGITKYEPPEHHTPQSKAGAPTSKKKKNPYFFEYTNLSNFKWYPDLFQEGELVVISEKVHGTSFRAGYVPFFANTWWKKIKKFFHLTPEYEFVYGSHRVQLQNKYLYTGFYKNNVYKEVVEKYNLMNLLQPGEVVYGEIYGEGIQPNYMYDCKDGERKFVVFDLQKDAEYQDLHKVLLFCDCTGLTHVPYHVEFYRDHVWLKSTYVDGVSEIDTSQEVKEGIVIKPWTEQKCYMGRRILKFKSDNFLLTQTDDTH